MLALAVAAKVGTCIVGSLTGCYRVFFCVKSASLLLPAYYCNEALAMTNRVLGHIIFTTKNLADIQPIVIQQAHL
jgi:hypothetical protein